MYQCPAGVSLGGGAWGVYDCQGQLYSNSQCYTIEYPSAAYSGCSFAGKLLLSSSPAPSGTNVAMYQCPSGISLGGGAWGYYGCQGQLSSTSQCLTIEYPSAAYSACTFVGYMNLK